MAEPLKMNSLNIVNTALSKIGFGRTLKATDASWQQMLDHLNAGMQRIVLECPFLFDKDFQIHLQKDFKKGTNESVSYVDNGHVISRAFGAAANTAWPSDGTLSEIDILLVGKTPDGDDYYEIREVQDVWTDGNPPNITEYLSLDRPVATGTGYTITDYTMIRRRYHLPIRFAQINFAEIIGDKVQYEINFVSRATAERRIAWPWRAHSYVADPQMMWLEEERGIRAPLTTPSVTFSGNNFLGTAEPGGTFDICYTHCFGYADEVERTPGGLRRPLLESAPSPIKTGITANATTGAIIFNVPRTGRIFGFHTGLRLDHSGRFVRIYLRRTAQVATGDATFSYPAEISNTFYPLLDIDESLTTTEWNGATTGLDKRFPLNFHGSLQTIGTFPATENRLTLNIHGKIDPPQIVDGAQAPALPQKARQLLEEAFLMEYCRGKEDNQQHLITAAGEFNRIKSFLSKAMGTAARMVKKRYPMRRRGNITAHYRTAKKT